MPAKKRLLGVMSMPVHWVYVAALFLVLSGCLYLFYPKVENFFIFYPSKPFDLTPETLRLEYKDIYFTAEDGTQLNGWFFPLGKDDLVVLHFHGNAGNISHRLDLISQFLQRKLQVFIIDYRGFGRSGGSPSEGGLYKDGLAAYDYLVQQEGILPSQIVVHGHSIGAAVAIEVALNRRVKSVILESAFTSTRDMAKTMPLFLPLSLFLPTNYNNLEKISRLRVPMLIVHGDKDEIVPFSMGERLFKAAKEPKFFYRVKGAEHNDAFVVGGDEYFRVLADFAAKMRI
jgi:fermentation-respiration switch protein FrsA (DUF1100 family)